MSKWLDYWNGCFEWMAYATLEFGLFSCSHMECLTAFSFYIIQSTPPASIAGNMIMKGPHIHRILVIYLHWRVSVVYSKNIIESLPFICVATHVLISLLPPAMLSAFTMCLLPSDVVYSDSHGKLGAPYTDICCLLGLPQDCTGMSPSVCIDFTSCCN